MKDTIYNEMQVREIVQAINENWELTNSSVENYLEFLKKHPNPEISAVAINYKRDDDAFLSDLMACPDFEHLMEEG